MTLGVATIMSEEFGYNGTWQKDPVIHTLSLRGHLLASKRLTRRVYNHNYQTDQPKE